MENKCKPTPEYLQKKLEETIHKEIRYFELFTATEIPSNWALYDFDLSYLTDKERYTIALYLLESDKCFLTSTGIAVYDHKEGTFIKITSCNDEG